MLFRSLLLLLVSVASWVAILRKFKTLRDIRQQNSRFEDDFWSGSSLNDLYDCASHNPNQIGPLERIFASGMREYHKLRERRLSDPAILLDGARRAMQASMQRELDAAESHLFLLASVGSVSPYVGNLF